MAKIRYTRNTKFSADVLQGYFSSTSSEVYGALPKKIIKIQPSYTDDIFAGFAPPTHWQTNFTKQIWKAC